MNDLHPRLENTMISIRAIAIVASAAAVTLLSNVAAHAARY